MEFERKIRIVCQTVTGQNRAQLWRAKTMISLTKAKSEYTLDPENWDEFRSLGHQMIDDMIAHLSTLDQQPAWRQMPAATEHASGSQCHTLPSSDSFGQPKTMAESRDVTASSVRK